MNTLETWGVSDSFGVRWWTHVSNAEVLQQSGLSTIGDILRHWGHLALHAWTLEYQHMMLCVWWCIPTNAGSPSQRLAQQGSGGCQRSTAIYAVKIWDRQGSWSGATVYSDYVTTTTTKMMIMMKDVSFASKMEGKTNFSRLLQAVRNRDCWMFENNWPKV